MAEIVHWVSSSQPQKNFLTLQIETITSDATQLAGAEMPMGRMEFFFLFFVFCFFGGGGGVIITENLLVR